MKKLIFLVTLLAATLVQAAPLSYSFVVDTSTFNTLSGQVNFQFNPFLPSDAASAVISGFSGGTLGSVDQSDGDVSGSLGTSLTLNNSQQLNRWIQNITFGNSLQFNLTISGPLLDNPSPDSNGTSFALLFTQGASETVPIFIDNTPGIGLTELFDTTVSQTAVPEPTTLWMLGLAVPVLYWKRKRS